MKLRQFLKSYYQGNYLESLYREGILPGTYKNYRDYRRTLSRNLDREIYYTSYTVDDNIYITTTTGNINIYLTINNEDSMRKIKKRRH